MVWYTTSKRIECVVEVVISGLLSVALRKLMIGVKVIAKKIQLGDLHDLHR